MRRKKFNVFKNSWLTCLIFSFGSWCLAAFFVKLQLSYLVHWFYAFTHKDWNSDNSLSFIIVVRVLGDKWRDLHIWGVKILLDKIKPMWFSVKLMAHSTSFLISQRAVVIFINRFFNVAHIPLLIEKTKFFLDNIVLQFLRLQINENSLTYLLRIILRYIYKLPLPLSTYQRLNEI